MKNQTEFSPTLGQISPEEPRITALIPSYNRAHLLPRAIDSVLNQTRPPYEVIVVDDGSTDNTREVMAAFGDQIRYIHQDNAGSAVARHHGISVARTEWIALLDSDDTWNPDHLERVAAAIVATDGVANYYFADTRMTNVHEQRMNWELNGFSIDGEPYRLLPEGSEVVLKVIQPLMLQATVLKRASYLACGGFLPGLRYRDDTHIFIKLGLKDPICAVGGGGTQMSDDDIPVNRLSLTYDQTRKGADAHVLMFQDLLDYFGDRLTDEEEDNLTLRLANAYLDLARFAWGRRDYKEFARYFALSGRTRPRAIIDMANRKLSG